MISSGCSQELRIVTDSILFQTESCLHSSLKLVPTAENSFALACIQRSSNVDQCTNKWCRGVIWCGQGSSLLPFSCADKARINTAHVPQSYSPPQNCFLGRKYSVSIFIETFLHMLSLSVVLLLEIFNSLKRSSIGNHCDNSIEPLLGVVMSLELDQLTFDIHPSQNNVSCPPPSPQKLFDNVDSLAAQSDPYLTELSKQLTLSQPCSCECQKLTAPF